MKIKKKKKVKVAVKIMKTYLADLIHKESIYIVIITYYFYNCECLKEIIITVFVSIFKLSLLHINNFQNIFKCIN